MELDFHRYRPMIMDTTAQMNATLAPTSLCISKDAVMADKTHTASNSVSLLGRKTGDAVIAMITGSAQYSLRPENTAFAIATIKAMTIVTFEFIL